MSCPSPLDPVVLSDYWLGVLPQAEESVVEEHLLGCDVCGDRLRDVIAMAEALRRLAQQGLLRLVVSDTFVQQAKAEGRRVREYDVTPGGSVACTVGADDDLLVARLAVDARQASRVDVVVCDGEGREMGRRRDIPLSGNADTVLLQESMTFAKASPTMTMVVRLLAVEQGGAERLMGEYTFNHTRTLPGPGHLE